MSATCNAINNTRESRSKSPIEHNAQPPLSQARSYTRSRLDPNFKAGTGLGRTRRRVFSLPRATGMVSFGYQLNLQLLTSIDITGDRSAKPTKQNISPQSSVPKVSPREVVSRQHKRVLTISRRFTSTSPVRFTLW
jgi:hypothetical protein